MNTFNSDGFNINYIEEKGITNNNVLFIHGNLASNEWWIPTMEQMRLESDQNTQPLSGTVLTADWRGYGKSKGLKTKEEISFETYANDYINLLESRGMTNVDVVGHSTGGLIAMMAVLKRPDLFRSCFFLDTVGPKGLHSEVPTEAVLAHFDKMSEDKDYAKMVYAATIEGVDVESSIFNELFEITWNCDTVCWRGVPDTLFNNVDISEELYKSWNTPSMIVHGTKDNVLPIKDSEELASRLQNSCFKALEGQGHSFNMEDPKRFNALLTEFWSGL